jgi:hypothetical protein
MVTKLSTPTTTEIFYPDCDGQPVANNTEQFEIIVLIKGNLDILFAEDPNVFIAGDLFWYPIEGSNTIKYAPKDDAIPTNNGKKATNRRKSYLKFYLLVIHREKWIANSCFTIVTA